MDGQEKTVSTALYPYVPMEQPVGFDQSGQLSGVTFLRVKFEIGRSGRGKAAKRRKSFQENQTLTSKSWERAEFQFLLRRLFFPSLGPWLLCILAPSLWNKKSIPAFRWLNRIHFSQDWSLNSAEILCLSSRTQFRLNYNLITAIRVSQSARRSRE